jgi:hypothetical protein
LLRAIPVAATVIVPKFYGAELGNFAAFAKLIKPSVLPGSARRRGNIHEKKEDSVRQHDKAQRRQSFKEEVETSQRGLVA